MGQMITIFNSILANGNNNITVFVPNYSSDFQKRYPTSCNSRTCRPLLHPRPLSTLRIPGYPTLVPGICTSTNILASRIPPRRDSDLVNTLGGKRAPFPNHLGSFAVFFPLRHDARLDYPPQQCRHLRELVFALLDQLFAKPHQRIIKTGQSSTLPL